MSFDLPADPPHKKESAHENRLSRETSPYLLQHAHNPVDWRAWDQEALDCARAEDKPIFLSIGYSACHWCHVMERESFENESIAALMNKDFVCIKVDREERPDLDEIYMNAVVALTGSGGWPMSVFLTPDLKPFYGGTYFPPTPRYGMPSFAQVLEQIARVWHEDRDKALRSAEELTGHLTANLTRHAQAADRLSPVMRENAAQMLESSYDTVWGGWGGAPKFPSPASISLLLRQGGRTGNGFLLEMATSTLRKMARGGMYDQIGGGFHRYSVDDRWLVPHFEKMLYDNARLAEVYTEAWQVTGEAFFQEIACETLNYVIRDMQDEGGAFYSSEDADSEGEEGKFYIWTRQELLDCLGEEEGAFFCTALNVQDGGNFPSQEPFHQGMNILHASKDTPIDNEERLRSLKRKVLAVRNKRIRPALDDKILTSWNGLMISALAKAGATWGRNDFTAAAVKAGGFIRDNLCNGGEVQRTWRLGRARFPGYLDDYAFISNAYIDLYESTADFSWLELAKSLAEGMIKRFHDAENGGFYATSKEHEGLLVRVKSLHDSAEPSPNAMAALALLRLGHLFSDASFLETARGALALAAPMATKAPLGFLTTILASDYCLEGPLEIVFAGAPDDEDILSLRQVLARAQVPCSVIAWSGASSAPGPLPITQSKGRVDNRGTVYVCAQQTCHPPEVTPAGFEQRLHSVSRFGNDS